MEHNKRIMDIGYVWAMIGSAIGFGPILSFSARCYFNGGGAFLIPLTIAMIVLGYPLLILEGIIGQQLQLPLVSAYAKVAGKFGKFFGWLAIFGVISIGSYYCVITAWTVAYMFYGITDSIPLDTATFFTHTFLQDSGSLTQYGSISYAMILSIIAIIACSWYVTIQSIKQGIEKFCSIFLPIIFILLIGFLFFIGSLEGSWNGFSFFLTPNFSLLLDPQIWLSAFGHVFFSFSLALGIIVGYSRYVNKEVNIAQSMLWVVIAEICTSVVAGLVIFGGIGYMAHIQNVPFESIITSSLFGLGFIVFPQIIVLFPLFIRVILATLFFFCLFIAGITGLFSIIEAAAGNFEVEFSWSRSKAISIVTLLIFILSLLYVGGNGTYIIDALDSMVSGFNVILSGIAQIILFMYTRHQITEHKAWHNTKNQKSIYYYALKYIALIILIITLLSSLAIEFNGNFDIAHIIRWTWFFGASILSIICAYCTK